MSDIHFLVDENAPLGLVRFLREQGYAADYVGEALAKMSPDTLLVDTAEQFGFVVITYDKDFKQLIKQVPHGSRTRFEHLAGRISLRCNEAKTVTRFAEVLDAIEFHYQRSIKQGRRFIMQISETSITTPS